MEKRQTQKNFIKLYLTCRSCAKVLLPETRAGSSLSPFFVSLEKCAMISTDVDISNSFRFKYSCHCNKKHICCEFELQSDSRKRVRYDEKSREIEHNLELTKENQKRVVEPLFYVVVIRRVPSEA